MSYQTEAGNSTSTKSTKNMVCHRMPRDTPCCVPCHTVYFCCNLSDTKLIATLSAVHNILDLQKSTTLEGLIERTHNFWQKVNSTVCITFHLVTPHWHTQFGRKRFSIHKHSVKDVNPCYDLCLAKSKGQHWHTQFGRKRFSIHKHSVKDVNPCYDLCLAKSKGQIITVQTLWPEQSR